MEYMCVPSIALICYIIAELFKIILKKNTKAYKGIPILVGAFGGIIGGALYLVDENIISIAPNVLVAIEVGIVSGLSSTGSHQVIKQFLKESEKNDCVQR